MIGGHPATPVRGSEAHAALAAIADYGIDRAATLYVKRKSSHYSRQSESTSTSCH